MEAHLKTIESLFSPLQRYMVPMFQRLYVWQQTPQWKTLWEDVTEKANLKLKGTDSTPHYLGALITEGVRSSSHEVKRLLVIDGQQRLTTLQILLCAFRDVARKNDWKTLDRASTRLLENPDTDVMESPEEERYKLWPTTLNRDVFRGVISAGSKSVVEEKFRLIRKPPKRKPEPRSNLVEGYLYFSKEIETWLSLVSSTPEKADEHAASALLLALKQDFRVVEIELSEGDDSQEIFYSLNSQGRPLSQSDLLRSLIFMRAEKERQNRDLIFENYWSKFETPFWSSEIKRGGRTYSRLDMALRYFLMAKTGQMVDTRRVNEEYRRWISATPSPYANVRDELADLAKFGDAYQKYEGAPIQGLPSTDLRRVLVDFDVSTATPLILYLEVEAGLNSAQVTDCLFVVESFLARRIFTREENKEYNKLFVEVIGSLRGTAPENVKDALIKKLLSGSGGTRKWPTRSNVMEYVISNPVFNVLSTPALRLILERLELAQRGKKAESHDVAPNLQIEHVMPQMWSTHWQLNGVVVPANIAQHPFLAKDAQRDLADPIRVRNSQLQRLGNLTLLNKYLNPAASNGSLEMKLIEYKNSVMRLNRYFDAVTKWDEDAIAQRGKSLGELLCKIWPRPEED